MHHDEDTHVGLGPIAKGTADDFDDESEVTQLRPLQTSTNEIPFGCSPPFGVVKLRMYKNVVIITKKGSLEQISLSKLPYWEQHELLRHVDSSGGDGSLSVGGVTPPDEMPTMPPPPVEASHEITQQAKEHLARLVREHNFDELKAQLLSRPPLRLAYLVYVLMGRLEGLDRIAFIQWLRKEAVSEPG